MIEKYYNSLIMMFENSTKILNWIGSMAAETLEEFLKALGF